MKNRKREICTSGSVSAFPRVGTPQEGKGAQEGEDLCAPLRGVD